jgi:Animal haem peroxidase
VWPFFGQFVAHDITADRSPVTHRGDADRISNFRVPRANLEGLYGSGPVGSPYLYARDDPAKLLLSPHGNDVPRNLEGIALIGDPRNDVHLFTSQMTVAFIALHNRLVDRLRADETAEDASFEEARRAATRHYQHVLVREFLPA